MTDSNTRDGGCSPRRPRGPGSVRHEVRRAPSLGAQAARSCRRLAASLLVATGLTAAAAGSAAAETRTLNLYFSHTGESISVVYKRDGKYDSAGLRELNRFLRDWRRNESTQMAPELFDLVWDVQQEFGGKTLNVVSAYRSPATNAMLRSRSRGVAKHSQHMEGHAMDFFIKGVDLYKLRVAGLRRQVGGVGYYPNSGSPFVHMDVGSVRAWPRLSRTELARIFPDGKTLHMPADGGPMSGYAEARELESEGKLARLDHAGGGSIGGGGGGSLFALLTGGGRRGSADGDQRIVTTSVAVQRSRVARPSRDDDDEEDASAPAQARLASVRSTPPASAPAAAPADGDVRSAAVGASPFRQLPSVSLGALIGRTGDDKPAEAPEVTPVALPATPLQSVAVPGAAKPPLPQAAPAAAAAAADAAAGATPAAEIPDTASAFVPPVPRAAPRGTPAAPGDAVADILVAAATPGAAGSVGVPLRRPGSTPDGAARGGIDALLPAAVATADADVAAIEGDDEAAAAADPADATAEPASADPATVEDAALDVAAGTARSAVPRTDTLAFADPAAREAVDDSPLSATAAYVPRSALAAPVLHAAPPSRPRDAAAAAAGATGTEPAPLPAVDGATLDALISPVVGATPELIANTSDVASDSFAELTRPNRNVAARDGILLAQGFLGAPSGLSDGNDGWLETDRFTGTRITVYARPRS